MIWKWYGSLRKVIHRFKAGAARERSQTDIVIVYCTEQPEIVCDDMGPLGPLSQAIYRRTPAQESNGCTPEVSFAFSSYRMVNRITPEVSLAFKFLPHGELDDVGTKTEFQPSCRRGPRC
jgi:hypothetical protein